MQACRQILEEGGPEQITTQKIADRAGVAIGSLYQYFPNKEAIIADVFHTAIATDAEAIVRETSQTLTGIMRDEFAQTLFEIVRMRARLYRRYLQLHGDFFRRYHLHFDFQSLVDQCAVERFQQPSWDEWLHWFLKRHQQHLVVPDISLAAMITTQLIDRLTEAAIDTDPALLESADYLQEIDRALIGYLCGKRLEELPKT